jgi:hypothetical protein
MVKFYKRKLPPMENTKSFTPSLNLAGIVFFGFLTLTFFMMILIIITQPDFSKSISEIFSSNVDSISLLQIKGDFGGSLVFTLYIALFSAGLIGLYGIIKNKKFNFSLLITISLISFTIFSGTFIIPQIEGTQPIRFNLNPYPIGVIECNGSEPMMLVGDLISCQINITKKSNLTAQAVKIRFTYQNLSSSETVLSRINETFIAPSDLRSLYFELLGTNSPNTTISTSWRYHFKTLEEYNADMPIFLASYLSLILLAFATIPSIVLNFKELINKKQ